MTATKWCITDTEWKTVLAKYKALTHCLHPSKPNGASLPQQTKEMARKLARTDLYFLLRYVLGRRDVEHPWLYSRIREVEENPDGYLDLWSREHYKSTIITSALTIRDILRSHGDAALETPEACVGIFSHTRPIAKSFLRQIKREFEANDILKGLFPDICWQNPRAEAPLWSEDNGITVKRKHNRREATVEAWGLVDGQPTSKHYTHMVYDDVVTKESVTTPEMVMKTTEAWELSVNLESKNAKRRMIGTRYNNVDTYRMLMERGVATPRLYPATHDGTFDGEPVFWTEELWRKKAREMGPKTAACQLLQNPREGADTTFRRSDLRCYGTQEDMGDATSMNKYLLVDPANKKKKQSDFTAMAVIGLGADRNYYVLDFLRDKLSLTERAGWVIDLHKRWRPLKVGYERYGLQADIEHIQHRQKEINYRFDIVELAGILAKPDRIEKLLPITIAHRLYLPESIIRMGWEKRLYDAIEELLTKEYDLWPVPERDDGLDVISRILDPDLGVVWPKGVPERDPKEGRYQGQRRGRGWRSL